jgi:hypothetical protein
MLPLRAVDFQVFIAEPTGMDRRDELIVGGLPLPRGAEPCGGWFDLVDADGRAFPVSGVPAAFWPDSSAKWLHVSGVVDLRGGQGNVFRLTRRTAAPPPSLCVRTDGDTVHVTGGILDVDISSDPARLLAVRRPGAESCDLVRAPGISAALEYVSSDGAQSRAFGLTVTGNPELVAQSHSRVVVRLAGEFADSAGTAVAELILFVEVLREAPEVRIEPAWIYLGQPNADLVKSLTLRVHLPLEAAQSHYGFGEERGPGFWDVLQRVRGTDGDGPRWPEARLVQSGSSFYRIEKRTCAEASWLKAGEGRRAAGWCHVADGRIAVTGAMRYFWQEYPHTLALDCDSGTMSFGLVPREAAPLDLRRYSPVTYGGAVYESGKPGPFRAELHGAHGIAKAHELMLRFHDPADAPAEIARRGLSFCNPCRLMAEPSHFAQSGVVGRLAAAEPCTDPAVERLIASVADFVVAERDYRGWYGLMDYGDIQIAFYSELDRWAYDDGGYAWLNTESLPDYGLWLSALRAARTDWLEAAIAMSRHNRDVDVYHRGQLRGLGSRHNVNHWGCPDKEWRISMPLVRRLHYYVTADPWTAECIRNAVAVYQSYDRTSSVAPSMTAALAGILVKWEMSGNSDDGMALRHFADVYAAAVRPDGQFTLRLHVNLATGVGAPVGDAPHTSTFFMNTFGGQHALVEIAELLGHAELSAALVRHAEFWADCGKAGRDVMIFLAHACRVTGEQRFADLIRKALAQTPIEFAELGGDRPLDVPRHRIIAGMARRNKVTCHGLGDTLHLLPYGLAALCRQGSP